MWWADNGSCFMGRDNSSNPDMSAMWSNSCRCTWTRKRNERSANDQGGDYGQDIMKLRELPFNTWFVLNRTGERLKKVGYVGGRKGKFWCKREYRKPGYVWPDWSSLHHLCGVTHVGDSNA